MTDVQNTLKERNGTHGDYSEQCRVTNMVKTAMRTSWNWNDLPETHCEALDMIAVKIGRLLTGNPDADDHWHDIAGYATLVEKEILEEYDAKA